VITRPVFGAGLCGAALTLAGLVGIVGGSGPHLDLGRIDPWLIVFAVGLGVAYGALAFGLHDIASRRTDDPEKRWERALTVWGLVAFAAVVLFALLGAGAGFDPASAAGAIAVVGLFESALIVVALGAFVLGS